MAVLTFTQITDSRFNDNIKDLLLERVEKIREDLSKLEGVSVKTNNFREIDFGDNNQYRCDFYVSKEGSKTKWNDVYKTINATKAVPYKKGNINFDDITDIPYKSFDKITLPGLNDSVRDWYMVAYPADDYGCAINKDVTFQDILDNEGNTMKLLGYDSVINERVNSQLTYILEIVEQNVHNWYKEAYPTDELCDEINPKITFKDVLDKMNKGEDIYDIMGVDDSLVRERVFDGLSQTFNIDYDVIYNKWLNENAYPDLKPGQKIDDEHIISVLQTVPRGMKCFGADARDNDKLGTIACICDGNNLFYLSNRLKDSDNVVKAALYYARHDADKTPLAYASERLRDNVDMVKYAVQNNPANLQFASKRIQDNPALLNGKVQANKSPLDDIIKGATNKANNQIVNDKPNNPNKSR